VRRDQIFGERLRATIVDTMLSDDEFSNDNFFQDVDNLFNNLNMGDTTDDDVAAAIAASVQVAPCVTLLSLSDLARVSTSGV
jgi:hypothetical protein